MRPPWRGFLGVESLMGPPPSRLLAGSRLPAQSTPPVDRSANHHGDHAADTTAPTTIAAADRPPVAAAAQAAQERSARNRRSPRGLYGASWWPNRRPDGGRYRGLLGGAGWLVRHQRAFWCCSRRRMRSCRHRDRTWNAVDAGIRPHRQHDDNPRQRDPQGPCGAESPSRPSSLRREERATSRLARIAIGWRLSPTCNCRRRDNGGSIPQDSNCVPSRVELCSCVPGGFQAEVAIEARRMPSARLGIPFSK